MRKIEILVIEDTPADLLWLDHVLRTLGIDYSLSAVTDGKQAVDFLFRRGLHALAPIPDLIFLDVHLPILSGLEIMRQVPNSRDLPICVLTSSETERQAFQKEFGIKDSNYLLKPVSQKDLMASARFQERVKVKTCHSRAPAA